jgi:hypothetical protein
MRKVLLATTALVAMTSVQAANADITISGGMDWSYYTYDDGTSSYVSDGNVKIKATTTADNGITYQVYQSVGVMTGTEEDSSITVSGDFGKIQMGGQDSVIDGLDGDVSHFANDWTNMTANQQNKKTTQGGNTATDGSDKTENDFANSICGYKNFQCRGEAGLYGAIGGAHHGGDGGNKIGYVSPTINNVTFAISSADTKDDRLSWAAKYKNGPIAVMYGMGNEGSRDDTAYGVGITFGDTTFRYQKGESKDTTAGAEFQVDRTEYGITHSIGEIGLWAGASKEEEKKTTAKPEFSTKGVGISYDMAPGVTLSSEYYEASNATDSENSTSINLTVAF